MLRDGLGVRHELGRPASVDAVRLAPVRLDPSLSARFSAVVGEANASAEPEVRLRHAGGKSTPDLLAVRAAGAVPAPDLVLAPDSHVQVLELLRIAADAARWRWCRSAVEHRSSGVSPFSRSDSPAGWRSICAG